MDAIKLGQEYELADYRREDFVYTKEMLLDPYRYAPRRQYHPDVDTPKDASFFPPPDLDLGEVYRTHRPLGAPITSPPETRHHPLA